MRIITEGKLPEEKVYRVICRSCRTDFEFFQKEGKVTYDQRDAVRVNCPLCKKEVYVVL